MTDQNLRVNEYGETVRRTPKQSDELADTRIRREYENHLNCLMFPVKDEGYWLNFFWRR